MAQQHKKSVNTIQTAINLHQKGDLQAAEKIYQQIIKKKPNHAEAQHLLGILYAQTKQFDKAYKFIHEAIKLNPKSATFYSSLGNVLKKQGKLGDAKNALQTALDLQPNNPAVHNNIGNLYYAENDLQTAQSHYQQAIELKPDYADAHYNLATLYLKRDNHDDAIAHFKQTITIQPQHPLAHGQLAQLLQQQHQIDAAISEYQKQLQIYPAHADSQHGLATLLVEKNNYEKAIKHFQETIKLQPKHMEANHNLGAIYLIQNQPEKALKYFLRQLEIKADAELYYNIGVIFMYQDRHHDAIEYLQKALKMEPIYLNAHINLGSTFLKLGKSEDALKHYKAALELQPDNQEISYLINALSQKGIPAAAPKEYLQHLFDQYAPYFDKHLEEYLHYQVPKLLYQAVIEEIGTEQLTWEVLDLGCGSGLCAEQFQKIASRIIGIDISEKMIEVAQQKKLYAELKVANIEEAMDAYHDIDLIIAGDVFTYIGDLSTIFKKCALSLKKAGLFAFTTEKSFKKPYQLQTTARYAHSQKYIKSLAKKNHFQLLRCDNAHLRTQQKKPVEGYLYILQKK